MFEKLLPLNVKATYAFTVFVSLLLFYTCLQIVVRTNIYSFLQHGTIQSFGHALHDPSVASQKLDCHAVTAVITYRETGVSLHHINTKYYSTSIHFQQNYFILIHQEAMLSITNVISTLRC